jgi:hypothetical protein
MMPGETKLRATANGPMKNLKVFNLPAIMIVSMSFIASAEEPAAVQGGLPDEPESRGPQKGTLFIHGGGGGG